MATVERCDSASGKNYSAGHSWEDYPLDNTKEWCWYCSKVRERR